MKTETNVGVSPQEVTPSKSIKSPKPSEAPKSHSLAVTTWDAALFVHIVWLIMLGLAIYLVWNNGNAAFYEDDWVLVPILTGNEPFTLEWLWRQNNEHRLPLTSLVILALYSAFDFDARSGMYFTVTLLALLALLLVWTVHRVRGRIIYADAFFPVVMLQWGQYDNFLFGHQVYQGVPVFLAGAVLCVIVWSGLRMSFRATVLAGTCVVALSMCGSMGVVFSPAIMCWFLAFPFAPLLVGRSADPAAALTCGTRCSTAALVFAVIVGAIAAVYFVGFESYYVVEGNQFPNHPPSPNPRATLVTAIKFLSMGYGSMGPFAWRASGLIIVGLVLITIAALVVVWFTRRMERLRVLGMVCFLGALIVLAAGIGIGRAGMGTDVGFSSRYVSLAALVPVAVYLSSAVVGGGMGRLVQMILFTLACVSVIQNLQTGWELGFRHHRFMQAFEDHLRAGAPPVVLAAHHTIGESPVYTCRVLRSERSLQEEFVKLMRMAHQQGKGIFRELNDIPTVEKPYPLRAPIQMRGVKWHADGTAECLDDDPHLTFALDSPERVIAIRVRYAVLRTPPPLQFEAYWRNSDTEDFTEKERYYQTLLPPDGEERLLVAREFGSSVKWQKLRAGETVTSFWVTIPVNATIDQFRIDPNNKPCGFKIEEIVLVVPSAEKGRSLAR